MVNHLRAFAKTYSAGGITFFMHPSRPIRAGVYEDAFVAGKVKPTQTVTNFLIIEPCTIDIEFGDTLSEPEQMLQAYWLSRSGNPVQNYDLYTLLPLEIVNVWVDAYNNTRSTVVQASPILQEGAPDKDADPFGGSSGQGNGDKTL